MEKKKLNVLALFIGAAVLLIVSIMYFGSAGTARIIAHSIDSGIDKLVEAFDEGRGSGTAMFLGGVGVGISTAVVYLLRLLGAVHIFASIFTAVMALIISKIDDTIHPKLYKGLSIWVIVHHCLFVLTHLILVLILGINVRSIVLIVGLLVSVVVSIYALVTSSKKPNKKIYSSSEPVIHM